VSNLISGLNDEEWEHIRNNSVIRAIKCVKDRLNCDLKMAKDTVDRARLNIPQSGPNNRPLTQVLENVLHQLDSMEYHIKCADTQQLERMRIGLKENIYEALKTLRGFI
jgi:hypothetical protein